MRYVAVAWVVTLGACVGSNAIVCDDGRICPQGRVCDEVHALCIFEAQETACAMRADGDVCNGEATTGICDRGVCIPGCGDGVTGGDEECDDGNFSNHDGCSSVCRKELPTWNTVPSPWVGRARHAMAFDDASQNLIVFGGITQQNGFSNAQWHRENGHWREILDLSPVPPIRVDAASAYDASRHAFVVFGGTGAMGARGDTWEFDTAWVDKSPVTSPPPGFKSTMIYDTVRSRIVLWSGADGTTWDYDGSSWTPIATTGQPPARGGQSMAWDPLRARAVMFGGSVASLAVNDTWELVVTGTSMPTGTWTLVTPAVSPAKRYFSTMAYLPSRQKIVLFGGTNNNGVATYGDTWEYGATGWTQSTGPVGPPGRFFSRLVLDPTAMALVLVGGATGGDITPRDDVWHYVSTGQWVDVSPKFPRARETALAYDSKRGEVIAFAGDLAAPRVNDTWAFDGTRWFEVTGIDPGPPWRQFHATAYDEKRNRVVLFGGDDLVQDLGDTYEWDGTRWTPSAAAGPPNRSHGVMAFDADAGVSVLHGGILRDGTLLTDTWEFDGAAWTPASTSGPQLQSYQALAHDREHHRLVGVDRDGATWVYANHAWSQLMLANAAPDHLASNLVYDHERKRLVLYTQTSALWELDDDGWHEIEIVGPVPPVRFQPGFIAHAAARQLVLFGGGAGGGVVDDTWVFQYRSSTPDELCDDELDNDGDHLVDRDDPDCVPR